jgi:hypothetical protein
MRLDLSGPLSQKIFAFSPDKSKRIVPAVNRIALPQIDPRESSTEALGTANGQA